jgi:hypothetical protein
MQTAYTLHMDHQLSLESIDKTGVLPIKVLFAQKSIANTACRR